MAYAVLAILVSPAVPSPASTIPHKHALQPPQFVAPVTALLFSAAADLVRALHWITAEQPAHLAMNGSELVDLTTARLC